MDQRSLFFTTQLLELGIQFVIGAGCGVPEVKKADFALLTVKPGFSSRKLRLY